MSKKYAIALDEGTTSARSVLYDIESKQIVSISSCPIKQYYPHDGWVEEDAEEIYEAQIKSLLEVTKGISPSDIGCIGITNQRETTIAWDSESGKPIYNAIVWQCRRGAPICEALKSQGYTSMIKDRTGLIIDSYFSATKMQWILANVPHAEELKKRGHLRMGTVDTYLIWRLTGGREYVTDTSNASRTMLFNIHTLKWDSDLMCMFGVDKTMLPEVVSSSGIVGYTTNDILGMPIPISGIAGDQQSALFGQGCVERGDAKNTYGTGCFMLMNSGKRIHASDKLLSTVAWTIGGQTTYALEGSIFNAGSSVQWLRDGLKMVSSSSETESVAISVEDNGGVYVVPAFTGMGAPYWDMEARGAILGLTRATTNAHIVRATLEATAYNTKAILDEMSHTIGCDINILKVDGGMSRNDFLMQYQSTLLGTTLVRGETEATAMGAVYLACLGVGLMTMQDIKSQGASIEYKPQDDRDKVLACYDKWQEAVHHIIK